MKELQHGQLSDRIKEHMLNDTWAEAILPVKQMYAFYECAIMEVETKFNVLNKDMSLYYDKNPIEFIKTRLKRMDSLVRKMDRKNLPIELDVMEEHIHDIAGVRVVCAFEKDIYLVADAFMKQDDVRVLEVKDYIKNPKGNGYRSLHIIVEVPIFLYSQKKFVKVEVQVRTVAMDVWASLEHKIRYKKRLSDEQLSYVDGILKQCADYCHEIDDKMGGAMDWVVEQSESEQKE